MVRSEVLETVEFNEPTEALFDMLTSEEQFLDPNRKKGKGKGKGKGRAEEVMPVCLFARSHLSSPSVSFLPSSVPLPSVLRGHGRHVSC